MWPVIRPAKVSDAPALAMLACSFARVNPSKSTSSQEDLAHAERAAQAILAASNASIFIAEIDYQAAAAMIVHALPSLTHGGRCILSVDLLVVREEQRRQRIGTALVKHAIQMARQVNAYKVLLVTRRDNEAARALYAGCGFAEEGVALSCYL
jgi:ribosomal protein S18 acetylase RimI-like enzyme